MPICALKTLISSFGASAKCRPSLILCASRPSSVSGAAIDAHTQAENKWRKWSVKCASHIQYSSTLPSRQLELATRLWRARSSRPSIARHLPWSPHWTGRGSVGLGNYGSKINMAPLGCCLVFTKLAARIRLRFIDFWSQKLAPSFNTAHKKRLASRLGRRKEMG